jgi:hypothetical protein
MAIIYIGCGESSQKRVYFGNLEDGANVESPFRVEMKTENLIVEPATMGVNKGHGHFHILVNTPLYGTGTPIPKDEKHIHYGQGETETILDLPVGQHTLVLQFATGDHVPYDPQVFQQIQINVTRQNPVPVRDSVMVLEEDSIGVPAGAVTDGVETAKDGGKP